MKKQVLPLILAAFILLINISLKAQIGINTDGSQPDPSAMLDVKSGSKGVVFRVC